MKKKIAVLGGIRAFRNLRHITDDVTVYHHIKHLDDLQGRKFSSVITLCGWTEAYPWDFNELLEAIENRII